MKKEVYCPNCCDTVAFKTIKQIGSAILDEKEYKFNEIKAICEKCGKEVFIDEYHDANLDSFYDVYRDLNGIVSREAVQSIPEKYCIGKRPLSILLGWGEQTMTRYLEGKIPTKEYSDVLKLIATSPRYYYVILEANKDKLTEIAYKKSKEAALELINQNSTSEPSIDRIANYILSKCIDITPLALQKGLYYSQGFSLGFTGVQLFNDDCQAWVHGPVYGDMYRKYKEYIYHPIVIDGNLPESVLTTSEKLIVDNVIQYLCCYSGKILEYFTHTEDPWINARKDVPENESSNEIVTKESIEKYFKKVIAKYDMSDPTDIKKYAADKFQKVYG